MHFFYKALSFLLYLSLTLAQILPFSVTGFLDSAQANAGTAVNRGGTVTISGYTVTIPDNLLVEFPALFVPFAEFTAGERAGPNEVTINGNIVGGQIIAGQMFMSQLSLAFGSGVISKLDTDGKITLASGPVLRINDPRARYSAGYTNVPFFTADDENPSISSFSGFPMCVPRSASDAQCPQSNRPAGATSFNVPQALNMVPIQVGDYVEYSGVQFQGVTLVYEMTVNVDIKTSGTQPGFVRIEETIIGVADTSVDVETARYRFIGLASRSDLPISVYAIDQDPCTGEETDRFITSTNVIASARNKFRVELPVNSNIGLYTRNYRFKVGDNVVTTSDGIKAGQFVQPVTEWIFPELVTPGGTPPPLVFDNIGPLANGFGPAAGDDTVFGQLKPWPGAVAPKPTVATCVKAPVTSAAGPQPTTTGPDDSNSQGTATPTASATTPTGPAPSQVRIVAFAGPDQTVLGGVNVNLFATQTVTGVAGTALSYQWSQFAGPTAGITLSSTTSPNISFVPPVVAVGAAPVSREFRVIITHTSGSQSNDTVVVVSDRTSSDNKVIDNLTWKNSQSGTATALAHTNLVDSSASMRIVFGSGTEQQMTKISTTNGIASYSFNARSTPRYTSAEIRSYIGNTRVSGPVVSSSNVLPG
ncbi:hypothetical protein BP5796_10082 [Coleophoma crateriformis]|uniref:Uncharacterized protein n=1 Tax=Coleophoma crateriformis TaxID=565419 RepID=A0A3D8QUQ5_9HELO|nr:hypothetical protein BP5796_10082 [Coleophoma crateriformis]